jgi:multiple sugar transport system permease protein/raffinose/stachyose/melibiose transport system permease protein
MFGALFLLPAGLTVLFSLSDWDGFTHAFNLVGLRNYTDALADPYVLQAFKLTTVLTLVATAILNLVALPLAALLAPIDAVTRVYRSIFFLPIVLSGVAVGFGWHTILGTNGVIDTVLAVAGIKPPHVLAFPTPALLAMAFVAIWGSVAFPTLLYLAGIKSIPEELVEAASIDGASPVQIFLRITLPLLKSQILLVSSLLIISFMRLYDIVVVLTDGGPVRTTETVAYRLVYEAINRQNFAYGNAISVLLVVLLVGLVGLLALASRLRRSRA